MTNNKNIQDNIINKIKEKRISLKKSLCNKTATFVHILHIIIMIIFHFSFLIIPNKYLGIYLICITLMGIHWIFFEGHCVLTVMESLLKNCDEKLEDYDITYFSEPFLKYINLNYNYPPIKNIYNLIYFLTILLLVLRYLNYKNLINFKLLDF